MRYQGGKSKIAKQIAVQILRAPRERESIHKSLLRRLLGGVPRSPVLR